MKLDLKGFVLIFKTRVQAIYIWGFALFLELGYLNILFYLICILSVVGKRNRA